MKTHWQFPMVSPTLPATRKATNHLQRSFVPNLETYDVGLDGGEDLFFGHGRHGSEGGKGARGFRRGVGGQSRVGGEKNPVGEVKERRGGRVACERAERRRGTREGRETSDGETKRGRRKPRQKNTEKSLQHRAVHSSCFRRVAFGDLGACDFGQETARGEGSAEAERRGRRERRRREEEEEAERPVGGPRGRWLACVGSSSAPSR
jgi:hypothetical protein